MRDDLGSQLSLDRPPHRVVSLVPSLTETVAVSAPGRLVGVTDWCTHPVDLDLPRIGGTKSPSIDAVLGLEPDLVLANDEENRPQDVAALRAAGVSVWVTGPRTVPAALVSLRRMLEAMAVPEPWWLREAGQVWSAGPSSTRARQAVIPVWRRPWVVVGSDTFAGDVLDRLGVHNTYGRDPQRYPRPGLDDIRAGSPDLIVLPDEPYPFTADDGPECFPGATCVLVSGRHLTWYGPSLVDARAVLERQLGEVL